MSEPEWMVSMTPEQRNVLAPPGLLYGKNRRNGSHQNRPRLDITYPVVRQTPETHTVLADDDNALPTAPLMSPEQSYLFDTMGYLHMKRAISADDVNTLNSELDWGAASGAELGKMLQVREISRNCHCIVP
eukprot:COSAG02_NODE_567_length_20212_cov_18.927460_12_plen_131_part_00